MALKGKNVKKLPRAGFEPVSAEQLKQIDSNTYLTIEGGGAAPTSALVSGNGAKVGSGDYGLQVVIKSWSALPEVVIPSRHPMTTNPQ